MTESNENIGEPAPSRSERTAGESGQNLSDLARPRIRSRSALLVGLAVGLALFVLVASAFSVAAESRVVATESNKLHSCDELLRSAITARSQLGQAVAFAQLDQSQGTDSGRVIDGAVADARTSLGSMSSTSGCLTDPGGESPLVTEFSRSGSSIADLLNRSEEGDLERARELLVGPLDTEFERLVDDVLAERDRLVNALTEADENLGQLGALATFIIAFFVPTVAMFVYRQITRRQRETIELARLLSEARTSMDWRSDLVHTAAALTEAQAELLPASSITSSLRSRLRDLDFLVGATALGHGYTFEAITIDRIRTEIQTRWPGLVSTAGDGQDLLWGDRRALTLLCDDLVRNAERRGALRVLISGGMDDNTVWLAITDNGSQLDPAAVDAILNSPSLIDATDEHLSERLDPDTSLVLIMGRMIAPALGGSFSSDRVGPNTRFTIRLPAARTRKSAAPRLTTSR